MMSRHNGGRSPKPWSKSKSRVEALFAPCRPSPTSSRGIACGDGLPLAVHCDVFVEVTRHDTLDALRHWVVLGRGEAGRIIWDSPGPFLRSAPGEPPRSTRGPPLDHREDGYGWSGRKPSEPSALMREYLDRPRERLMEPFEDSWELAAILRAADRRLGRTSLLDRAEGLDSGHPALGGVRARFGVARPTDGHAPKTTRRGLPGQRGPGCRT